MPTWALWLIVAVSAAAVVTGGVMIYLYVIKPRKLKAQKRTVTSEGVRTETAAGDSINVATVPAFTGVVIDIHAKTHTIVLTPGTKVTSTYEGSYEASVNWFLVVDNVAHPLVGKETEKHFEWTVPGIYYSQNIELRVATVNTSDVNVLKSKPFSIIPVLHFATFGNMHEETLYVNEFHDLQMVTDSQPLLLNRSFKLEFKSDDAKDYEEVSSQYIRQSGLRIFWSPPLTYYQKKGSIRVSTTHLVAEGFPAELVATTKHDVSFNRQEGGCANIGTSGSLCLEKSTGEKTGIWHPNETVSLIYVNNTSNDISITYQIVSEAGETQDPTAAVVDTTNKVARFTIPLVTKRYYFVDVQATIGDDALVAPIRLAVNSYDFEFVSNPAAERHIYNCHANDSHTRVRWFIAFEVNYVGDLDVTDTSAWKLSLLKDRTSNVLPDPNTLQITKNAFGVRFLATYDTLPTGITKDGTQRLYPKLTYTGENINLTRTDTDYWTYHNTLMPTGFVPRAPFTSLSESRLVSSIKFDNRFSLDTVDEQSLLSLSTAHIPFDSNESIHMNLTTNGYDGPVKVEYQAEEDGKWYVYDPCTYNVNPLVMTALPHLCTEKFTLRISDPLQPANQVYAGRFALRPKPKVEYQQSVDHIYTTGDTVVGSFYGNNWYSDVIHPDDLSIIVTSPNKDANVVFTGSQYITREDGKLFFKIPVSEFPESDNVAASTTYTMEATIESLVDSVPKSALTVTLRSVHYQKVTSALEAKLPFLGTDFSVIKPTSEYYLTDGETVIIKFRSSTALTQVYWDVQDVGGGGSRVASPAGRTVDVVSLGNQRYMVSLTIRNFADMNRATFFLGTTTSPLTEYLAIPGFYVYNYSASLYRNRCITQDSSSFLISMSWKGKGLVALINSDMSLNESIWTFKRGGVTLPGSEYTSTVVARTPSIGNTVNYEYFTARTTTDFTCDASVRIHLQTALSQGNNVFTFTVGDHTFTYGVDYIPMQEPKRFNQQPVVHPIWGPKPAPERVKSIVPNNQSFNWAF